MIGLLPDLLHLASLLPLLPLLAILIPLALVLALDWHRLTEGEAWEATLVEDPPSILVGAWGQSTVAALRAIGKHEAKLLPIEVKYLRSLVANDQPTVALATIGGYLRHRAY